MLKLIKAEPDDLDRLSSFYRSVIDNTPSMSVCCRWIYGLHPSDELIREYINTDTMYCTEADGQLLSALAAVPYQDESYHDTTWGITAVDDEVMTIHILGVHPACQGQGIARRTMAAAEALAGSLGKKAVRLDALKSNTPAQRMYEALGYVRRDEKRWYACNIGWTDFILYEKPLK